MKFNITFFILFGSVVLTTAQSRCFSYDAAGNRTSRAYRFSVCTSDTFQSIARTSFGFSYSSHYIPKGASYVYRRYVGL